MCRLKIEIKHLFKELAIRISIFKYLYNVIVYFKYT